MPASRSGLRAGVHRDADVGLGQRGSVVGAVADHGDELALGLFFANEAELGFGGGFGAEVIDAGFGGDRGGGERIVAGDHDGPQAHRAQAGEALLDAILDHVLEIDNAHYTIAIGDDQRRAAGASDTSNHVFQFGGLSAAMIAHELHDLFGSAFTDVASAEVESAHAGLSGEGDEGGIAIGEVAAAKVIFALGQDDDGAAFGGFVGERGELRGIGEVGGCDAADRNEFTSHAITESNRAGLVEKQSVNIAGGLDRAAGHCKHVVLNEAIHAGNADGGKEAADGGRDQADEQRNQNRQSQRGASIESERVETYAYQHEDDSQSGQENTQCNLIGGFLA